MIYKFGEQLIPVNMEEWEAEQVPAVFVTDSRHADAVLAKAGIVFENEIQIAKIGFCRLENQQDCVVGTLCIPKILDVLGSRYRMYFFVNSSNVVIVDDEDFSQRLIRRIQRKRTHQGETKERFLYNYISEFISRDLEMLVAYERRLLRMEEDVSQEHIANFQSRLMPIRRELLNLRSYYDEIMDLTKALEENENGFFLKKQLKYFGTLTDRADRLMSRTGHLLEYAQQVKEAYQAQIDARQNSNMQFLTVLSTIFFPLTLITGWYGMNFRDMPGLDDGYPWVVCLSIVVILICLFIFKKKHII